jgi:hypothetical protein
MDRLPTTLNDVLTLACPFTSGTVPNTKLPDLKVTLPRTVPKYWLVTEAV